MRSADILNALDTQQRDAATELKGPLVILAGAGTGKTRTITHRIAYGVHYDNWDPDSILAVTFTTKAANEMRERLEGMDIEGVTVRTFHAQALKQLYMFWSKVSNERVPQILNDKISIILEAANDKEIDITRNEAQIISEEISWAKVSLVSASQYCIMADATDREAIKRLDSNLIARLYDIYDTYKSQRGLIDFEDVLLLMIYLIDADPSIANEIRTKYLHIVVDEFQDVCALQWELLKAWLGNSKELCVVGDPSQTIYSFAGSCADYLVNFHQHFNDSKLVRLTQNYRSTRQIVDLANTVLKYRGRESYEPLSLNAFNQSNSQNDVIWNIYQTDQQQANDIAKIIADLVRSQSYEYRDIAVLFRTNSQANDFINACSDAKIPFWVKTNAKDEDDQISIAQKHESRITLASLHSTKGLEWDIVFLVGLSDGFMPISRVKLQADIEEERRLLYVGITRAKCKLYMSFAKYKQMNQSKERHKSRFLDNIWPA